MTLLLNGELLARMLGGQNADALLARINEKSVANADAHQQRTAMLMDSHDTNLAMFRNTRQRVKSFPAPRRRQQHTHACRCLHNTKPP